MKRGLLGLGLWLWATPVLAQVSAIPVFEVGANLFQNTITAIESVAQTINMVLELTPVDEFIAAPGISEDMGMLGDIVANATGLSYDIGSLNAQISALLHRDNRPVSVEGVNAYLVQYRQIMFDSRAYALRTQTLMTTLARTVEHLAGLMESLGGLVGNMQGNQRSGEIQGTMSKTLAMIHVNQVSYQRGEVTEKMMRDILTESMLDIEQHRWEDFPRFE